MSLEQSIASLQKTMIELIEAVENVDTSSEVKRTTFTTDEAAEYVGVGREVLLQAAKDGEVKHFKNGTRYIFRKGTLDKWITKMEDESVLYRNESQYMNYLQDELKEVK